MFPSNPYIMPSVSIASYNAAEEPVTFFQVVMQMDGDELVTFLREVIQVYMCLKISLQCLLLCTKLLQNPVFHHTVII
jgi:hypothetical protein